MSDIVKKIQLKRILSENVFNNHGFLHTIQERMLGFACRGTPVGCIVLELVLSGNGLQLSKRFCELLRTLCTRTDVTIVVDEILTGFRCCSSPTVLLSDVLGLKPNYIVLAKFIGCGLILEDTKMRQNKFLWRARRYPTTNCPVEQVLGIKLALSQAVNGIVQAPDLFDRVEETIRKEFPSAIGRGLLWFFNCIVATPIPAPKGVKRLLFKIFPPTDDEIQQMLAILRDYRALEVGDSLNKHVMLFQKVVRDFAEGWHNRQCVRFRRSPDAVFGVCHAVSKMTTTKTFMKGKKDFYSYAVEQVRGLNIKTVQRVMVAMAETCGDNLIRVSTLIDDGVQKKVLRATGYTLMFLGGPQKRKKRTSVAPAAAAAVAPTPVPAPTPAPAPTPESENPVLGV